MQVHDLDASIGLDFKTPRTESHRPVLHQFQALLAAAPCCHQFAHRSRLDRERDFTLAPLSPKSSTPWIVTRAAFSPGLISRSLAVCSASPAPMEEQESHASHPIAVPGPASKKAGRQACGCTTEPRAPTRSRTEATKHPVQVPVRADMRSGADVLIQTLWMSAPRLHLHRSTT